MYEAYKTLTDNGIKAYSVKTDCLTLHEGDLDKVCVYRFCRVWRRGLLKFGFDIGDWRMEETKTITIPTQLYTYKTNVLPDIPRVSNMSIEVEDEWDTKTICEIKLLRNPGRIRGKFPGMGKSYTGEHFQQMGKNVIFVVPTDRLYKKRMWKQQPITGFPALLFMKMWEKRCQSLIITLLMWWCLMRSICLTYMFWIKVSSSLRTILIFSLLGTGDVQQLQRVEVMTNCQNPEVYMDNCIDIVFKYNIFLQVCKRVGAKNSEEGQRSRESLVLCITTFGRTSCLFKTLYRNILKSLTT